ncbi:MAG: hypothetical protein LBU70_07505 [Chitinispirillales bacterium]|nr:hypothetical protein [Chitinispirillales bacterium]
MNTIKITLAATTTALLILIACGGAGYKAGKSDISEKDIAKKIKETADKDLESNDVSNDDNFIIDVRDGQRYRTVRIGELTWMAENLNYETDSSWCSDYDDEVSCQKYGRLYNWNAALAACPAGWRLPVREDWDDLIDAAGGLDVAGEALKSTSEWRDSEIEYYRTNPRNGTDVLGFSAIPGGLRTAGGFYDAGSSTACGCCGGTGYWWSAADLARNYAQSWNMHSLDERVNEGRNNKNIGMSVRCVRGREESIVQERIIWPAPDTSTFIDPRDGQTYRTVKIGTQTWMAENLNFNADGSACYADNAPNCEFYGRLYDWATVMNGAPSSSAAPSGVQGVCPDGWHIPSDAEWDILVRYVDRYVDQNFKSDRSSVGSIAGQKLQARDSWASGGVGCDEFYFSALGGGSGSGDRSHSNRWRVGGGIGLSGYWWSTTEDDTDNAWCRHMLWDVSNVRRLATVKTHLFSVRCVRP